VMAGERETTARGWASSVTSPIWAGYWEVSWEDEEASPSSLTEALPPQADRTSRAAAAARAAKDFIMAVPPTRSPAAVPAGVFSLVPPRPAPVNGETLSSSPVCLPGLGKADQERHLAGAVLRPDLPLVPEHNLAGDGQPQAVATVADPGRVGPVKPVKD